MNPLSARDSRLPLYQRLRDELLQRIAEGQWSPGNAIPTEAELTWRPSLPLPPSRAKAEP